ncbi:MAG TPA: hypothetical protein ENI80_05915 [Acidiferrobacteraceae bacterium]|nr:hypothetical protein [Acidiferrobacteraceae bacterium]
MPRFLAKGYRSGAENLHMIPMTSGTERYEKQFGVTAVEMGYITPDQLVEALRTQIQEDLEEGKHRLLGQILREQELMSPNDIETVLCKSLSHPSVTSRH